MSNYRRPMVKGGTFFFTVRVLREAASSRPLSLKKRDGNIRV